MAEVNASLVMSDGSVMETTVGWLPMDESPRACAEREAKVWRRHCVYRIIHTTYVYPPIPDRSFDWSAAFDGYEPGDIVGHGATEQEAIEDLHGQLDDQLEDEAFRKFLDGRQWSLEEVAKFEASR